MRPIKLQKSDFEFIVFWLAFSLIIAEFVFCQMGSYIFSAVSNQVLSFGVYMSISIGSCLGLTPVVRRISSQWLLFTSVVLFSIGFLGLLNLAYSAVWVTLSFLGYGLFLTIAFSRFPLRTCVLSMGMGSLVAFLLIERAYFYFGAGVLIFACVAPAWPLIFNKNLFLKMGSSIFAALMLFLFLYSNELFLPKGFTQKNVASLQNANRKISTHFSPLLITDLLYRPDNDRHFIITNGSRFSEVIKSGLIKRRGVARKIPTFSTPYLISNPKKVLIIGPAGGLGVSFALENNADEIVAVDVNPMVFKLMQGPLRQETGDLYLHPKVRTIAKEGRNFLETTSEKFDLITIQGVQTGTSNHILNSAIIESFLLTKESIQRIWELLTPTGIAFLEEYKVPRTSEDTSETLIGSLTKMTAKVIPREKPEQHLIFATYNNANWSVQNRQQDFREFLMIGKEEISSKASLLKNAMKVELNPLSLEGRLPPDLHITDNKPFFVRSKIGDYQFYILTSALVMIFLAWLTARTLPTNKIIGYRKQILMFQGVGFTCTVMSLFGPATLFIGYPQLASPTVFCSLFFFGLIGAIIFFSFTKKIRHQSYLLILFLLFAIPISFEFFKSYILGIESVLYRFLFVFLVIGILSVALEIPYLFQMNEAKHDERSKLFVFGKLGSLFGIGIGVFAQIRYGFIGVSCAAFLSYFLALMIEFRLVKNSKF